jgi:hypothetical protein
MHKSSVLIVPKLNIILSMYTTQHLSRSISTRLASQIRAHSFHGLTHVLAQRLAHSTTQLGQIRALITEAVVVNAACDNDHVLGEVETRCNSEEGQGEEEN